jgi:hypothetical protein
MPISPLADMPTCPTCRRSSSLWFEFGTADCRREYYRCGSCGRSCEIDRGPCRPVTPLKAREPSDNQPSRRAPPWWVADGS